MAALCEPAARVLVVQATGWGKSAVYWAATAIRRAEGAGPTLVVSPLLSLMRDQVAAAEPGRAAGGDAELLEHRRVVGRSRPTLRAGDARRAAGLARAAGQPRLRPAGARRAGRAARPAGDRRGARGLRLGPRLPARLPAGLRRAAAAQPGHPGARDDRDGQRSGSPTTSPRSSGDGTLVLRGPLARDSLQLSVVDAAVAARALRLGGRPPAAAAGLGHRLRADRRRRRAAGRGDPRPCTATRCRSPPTPGSSTPAERRAARGRPARATGSRRWSPPRRSAWATTSPTSASCVHVGVAAVAGVLLPAGRPCRPRHRPRARSCCCPPTPTPASGTTSPPRPSPTPTRCERLLDALDGSRRRAGRRVPRWRPRPGCAAAGSS